MSPTPFSKATALRRKAAACGTLAACARSAADRRSLIDLRDLYLSRALQEDWIDGLPPLPPANANALPAPRTQR